MDKNILNYLDKLSIDYKAHQHEAIFTVEQAKQIDRQIPGVHSKNLFLIDKKGEKFLVCMKADKRLDIKKLQVNLGSSRLSFSKADELKQELGVTPGSVSMFAMIYAKDCQLVIDQDIWNAEITGFHPNVNTATLEITHDGVEKFVNSLDCKKSILEM